MQALILAAGMGTRFGKMTANIPKGFIHVAGKPMVIKSIELLKSIGIDKIVIGTGYHKEKYEELATSYENVFTCFSPKFASTNSMFTLYNSRQMLTDDFLLLESDIIYDKNALEALITSSYKDAMLVTPVQKFQDQYYVEFNQENILVNCSTDKNDLHFQGEMVGIHKLSLDFYQKMCADYFQFAETQPKMGYEFELLRMSQLIQPMYVVFNENVHWYEIDDEHDLAYAEKYVAKYC